MNGEIDLELYTISLIRLNTAFQKLDGDTSQALSLMNESAEDLENFYEDVINDLNQEEVNFTEYYPFFENGKQTFPQYISILGEIENVEMNETVLKLINIFSNLNKIAEAFPAQGEYAE